MIYLSVCDTIELIREGKFTFPENITLSKLAKDFCKRLLTNNTQYRLNAS